MVRPLQCIKVLDLSKTLAGLGYSKEEIEELLREKAI